MKNIAVFCGSSGGKNEVFSKAARNLGEILAKENITLIYGGAKIGLMGAVADAVLKNGGEVIGVLPHFLGGKEIAHPALTKLIMVDSMHERKMKMHELNDAVIALPGGFGTIEELFEILTWAQLGLHQKPVGILNVNGYYDSLIKLMDEMVDNGFLKQLNRNMVLVSPEAQDLLQMMSDYKAPEVKKWISEGKT